MRCRPAGREGNGLPGNVLKLQAPAFRTCTVLGPLFVLGCRVLGKLGVVVWGSVSASRAFGFRAPGLAAIKCSHVPAKGRVRGVGSGFYDLLQKSTQTLSLKF